ncbi:hypothetical protein LEP1GSC048_1195 [Leptospira santarosai serovar Shermani str. 1342KT]|nr:hypothetical protein LEP1GSC048_1195 [Leptospira santarosai serovar Shermani str. 1342KT]
MALTERYKSKEKLGTKRSIANKILDYFVTFRSAAINVSRILDRLRR